MLAAVPAPQWAWPAHLAAPAAAAVSSGVAAGLAQVLYLQEPGDPSPISVNDIHQGQIGDCFLLSSIGELALFHPGAIGNIIQANANGTETVTLYLAASGQLPTYGTTAFKPTAITVGNVFPSNCVNNGATQDVANGQKEIWVQVLEKAVATLNGGYGGIANGGNPMIAMEELTGQSTSWTSPAALTLQQLQSHVAAGDLIVMDTPSSGTLPYGLVNSHAYMFDSLTVVNGVTMVQLDNPWGPEYRPQLIPFTQLASGIVEVDFGHSAVQGTSGADVLTLSATLSNGSIDLGAGADRLTLADGGNAGSIGNVETLIGGSGGDTVTLSTAAVSGSIDLGAGNDVLILARGNNKATIANVETLTGNTGTDTIMLGVGGPVAVDLGTGRDQLTLASSGNTVTASNVEVIIGGAGGDAVVLGTAQTNASIDLGAGNDRLTLAGAGDIAFARNVETVQGGAGSDAVTLQTAAQNASIDLGGGSDKLIFAAAGNTATIANVETLLSGTGADSIVLAAAVLATSVDLGGGNDQLTLANAANTVSLANAETLTGGSGDDTVTLRSGRASVDLGAGNDRLTLADTANTTTVANVETLTGGAGADTVVLAGALTPSAVVDLKGGANKLTLLAAGNTGTVSNVRTFIGGAGADSVTFGAPASNASIDLGGGSDALTLADGGNTVSVAKVETLTGGAGTDAVTFRVAAANASIDLGAGNDVLKLADVPNAVTAGNTETVLGGRGADTIVLTGANSVLVRGGAGMNFVTGNAGADQFVLDQNAVGSYSTILNFDVAKGDRLALDTTASATMTANAYNIGGTGLVNGVDLACVADVHDRLATKLVNGGKGAFVYQQDSGGLYYSGNGVFSGGGRLIGVVTSDGATPWVYNQNAFEQV